MQTLIQKMREDELTALLQGIRALRRVIEEEKCAALAGIELRNADQEIHIVK